MGFLNENSRVDAVSISRATEMANYIAKESIRHTTEYMADSQKEKRLQDGECKTCFYFRSGRIGGAAMTTSNCEVCNKEMSFGNTNVDRICPSCSKEHSLCVRCGGDILMRVRRKDFSTLYDNASLHKVLNRTKKLVKGAKADLNAKLDQEDE